MAVSRKLSPQICFATNAQAHTTSKLTCATAAKKNPLGPAQSALWLQNLAVRNV